MNGLFGWADALAFRLGGQAVRWSDLLGNLLGLATVALAIRRSLWAWPVQTTGAIYFVLVIAGMRQWVRLAGGRPAHRSIESVPVREGVHA